MRRAAWLAAAALLAAAPARADIADYLGTPVAAVTLELEGREIADPKLQEIVETRVGSPFSMLAVRETVTRLFSLGRYEDVRVYADAVAAGVNLTYDLIPMHPIEKIAFAGLTGRPGIDVGLLKRDVVERYGASPPLARVNDLARIVEDDLHGRGYLHPVVTPRLDIRHRPDRATLVFTVDPGVRTTIGAIDIVGTSGLSQAALLDLLDLAPGNPYESDALDTRIAQYVEDRRSKGYLEAKLVPATALSEDDRVVRLTLNAEQGPRVRVVFKGDPLPEDARKELVPIEREGSADEDLLEDSSNRIEDYLRADGYRDAAAPHERQDANGELLITFTVKRGSQYRVARVEISGNQTMSLAEIEPGIRVKAGDPFSEAKLDADVSSLSDLYHRQGFSAVNVQSDVQPVPNEGSGTEALVDVHLSITENVRTIVGSMRIEGNASIPDVELTRNLALQPGRPFSDALMALDRDAIELRYANLGFQNATVAGAPRISDGGRADIVFTVVEGPQLFVDHILIVGNVRTKTEVIEHELQFKPGDPLGVAAIADTQRRLATLGLFRRTDITAVGHGQSTRDVLISLDEAPVTTIGYGVGVEASERVVSTAASGGVATQHLEFAPRAFFQIGRSNLFGKNRSLNLSSLLSLRPKDSPYFASQPQNTDSGGQFGFAEYRILLTYREPRVFGTSADAFLNGTIEQQVRSSFDFARRAFSAEFGRRVTRAISVSGNYQIQQIQLFNEAIAPADQLLIDRLFPQIRLSSFSGSVIRNTRDDALDPSTGTYLSMYGQLAARAIGSEVGLAKSYLTAQMFRTIPHAARTVFAASARVGTAVGFPRRVTTTGADGQPVVDVVKDLPASERFFAGGDTTVRGFAIDQLGTANTLDPTTGLAIGGNALVVLNAELRVPYRNFQVVGFFDMGNVFAQPSAIDFGQLRSAVGFGLRYKSPVGPIRVDLGFKIHRHDIVPGTRESLTALHISLGQAF